MSVIDPDADKGYSQIDIGEFHTYTQTDDKTIHEEYCKGYKYYPLILPKQDRIIAIGDLHGDFNLMINALKLAKVLKIEKGKYRWIGGNTVVVQVGDQLDNCRPLDKKCGEKSEKGEKWNNIPDTSNLKYEKDHLPDDIKIMVFMNDLNKQANKHGGGVISLLGNHELMNVDGNMSHVSYKDLKKLSRKERINAFKPGGEYARLLACSRLPAVIIGSFIFVHAGFIEPFIKHLRITNKNDLYKISVALRKWLLGMIDKNNVVDIITSGQHSMFWNRILGAIPPNMSNNHPDCVSLIHKVLKLFEVKGMAIGHTPQFFINKKGINQTCNDQLWRVDFGGSFGFHKFDKEWMENNHSIDLRDVQVLEITDDKDIRILKMDR